ncbi:winged helix-turn-helix domain-containing protein [Halobellus salinisoli]|uniref:winged helix-turn-helix domain-containing protein n=1 Tax=Halobellus salinisoli TaxID=3108500 RepID=UPI00300A7ECA
MDVEEYSWVKASGYRENILLALEEKPRTPKELAERTEYYLSHVSNTLSDLNDHGLAECITPDRRKGRLWTATGKGQKIIDDLKR